MTYEIRSRTPLPYRYRLHVVTEQGRDLRGNALERLARRDLRRQMRRDLIVGIGAVLALAAALWVATTALIEWMH